MVRIMDDIMEILLKSGIDKQHSEKLAKAFFILLDEDFKMLTLAYAIFIIVSNSYDMIASQDKDSADMFKSLMVGACEMLGEDGDE